MTKRGIRIEKPSGSEPDFPEGRGKKKAGLHPFFGFLLFLSFLVGLSALFFLLFLLWIYYF